MLLSETAHSILTALLRSSLTVGTNLSLCNFHPQVLILSPGTTQKKPNPSSSFHTVSRSKIWIQLSSLPWLLWEAEYGFPQRRWCPNPQNLSAPAHAQPCLCDPMVAHQTPLSMGFFRQEYWSGLPLPLLRDLPNPGIKSTSPASLALAGIFFTTEPPGSPKPTREETLKMRLKILRWRDYLELSWWIHCNQPQGSL